MGRASWLDASSPQPVGARLRGAFKGTKTYWTAQNWRSSRDSRWDIVRVPSPVSEFDRIRRQEGTNFRIFHCS